MIYIIFIENGRSDICRLGRFYIRVVTYMVFLYIIYRCAVELISRILCL
jgi:hypothetical protein